MGYKIAILRDEPALDPGGDLDQIRRMVDVVWHKALESEPYVGYAKATNGIIKRVRLLEDADARWFVIGGDDVFPDTTKRADEIAQECEQHFHMVHSHLPSDYRPGDTFGCMQCTGDSWGDKQGPYIERVAGSAWIGREFALRAYGGNGPLWPEYFHMYPDEELQLVAQKLGVFWQRPDLTQIHQHWGRPKEGETMGHSHNMPEFLKRANSDKEWDAAKKLFEARKAAGFPGHEVKA
jgi:hypothetical protein